jgi:hypothetical protein
MPNITMHKIMPAVAVATAAIVGGTGITRIPAEVIFFGSVFILIVATLVLLSRRAVHFLDQDDQLRVQCLTETVVYNGPGMRILNPFGYRLATTVKAEMLSTLDYVCVVDSVSGLERVVKGPMLFFLGAHEHIESKGRGVSLNNGEYNLVENKFSGEKQVVNGPCVWFPSTPHEVAKKGVSVSLSTTEYIIVQDRLSGEKHTVKGPRVWIPGPHEEVSQTGSSISLNRTEYITVENTLSGEMTIVKGACTWFRGPYDNASQKQEAISLQDDEYLRLKDLTSGNRWVEKGPSLVFLEPMWKVEGATMKTMGVQKAWILKANEYIRLIDGNTGRITVHRGEKKVFPGPDEIALESGVQKAIGVDGEHAVLVRDKGSGQLRLVTDTQLFVPGPNDHIEEIRELIKLADHEAMILKDADGNFQYYYGSDAKRSPDQPKAFFLPPHSEIVKIWWSRGPRRERKDVSFERFDCRPHFMKFEFNCRTSDNVELVLEGVLFWELVDLPAMWRHTGDTSGDMVYHIRSKYIHSVGQVTLKLFMESLHDISKNILEEDLEFYATRGIKVHSLEVTRYQCADKSTAEILEQIIHETTNRMNRLSQAESENEVNLFRTQGQVEQSR